MHPAYLIMPSCIAVSLSFMLPIGKFKWNLFLLIIIYSFIATPTNAMILSTNDVKISDLMKAGIGLKLFGIVVIFIQSILLIPLIFDVPEVGTLFNNTVLINSTSN